MPTDSTISAARGLLQQIGLELAFAPSAGAAGAATLRRLLDSLTESLPSDAPPDLRGMATAATGWLTGQATLSPEIAARFNLWHPWMEEAVSAWSHGLPLPAAPAALPTAAAASQPAGDDAEPQAVTVLPQGADEELMRLFCAEAEDLLRDIEQGVLTLEDAPGDADTLATVFRAFHTFKGNAAVMKLVVLQRLAHELESLLDAARRGTRPLTRSAIDVILAGADVFSRYVAEAARQLDGHDAGRSIPLPIPAVVARVRGALSGEAAAPPPAPPAAPLPVAPLVAATVDEPLPVAPAPPPAAPTLPTAADPPAPARVAAAHGGSIRVDTQKLDGLVDLVGELVIAQSMVTRGAEAHGIDEHLARSLGQLRGITADLQRTALALRMIPIRSTFQKMTRLVRDLAGQLGKEIRLVVEGDETEVDRTVIEEIGDPLMHMVRNAADHGIETAAARAASGKPAAGTITLRARHQGGFVVIEIADDGAGLDPARLRAKAIERGLIAADAILDDHDALELIFAAGFSTAEHVSDLSGRGVGMDVVRRNIERLRGTVEIDSRPGVGTTFTIFLPLTLAIIEGLLVAVGEQQFILPAVNVRESFRPRLGDVTTVQRRGELVDVRGQLLPLLRLGRHLGIETATSDPMQAIVVVVEAGHDRRGLLVDALLGRQEVVIKGLGETFIGHDSFAGAAILGDGRVGLILDTTALVRLSTNRAETAA
jgi:two-component system, chemotaxis family, sensor kinase CheA